jgi:hypothetical protein
MDYVTRSSIEELVRKHYAKAGVAFLRRRERSEEGIHVVYFRIRNGAECGWRIHDLEAHAREIGVLAGHEAMSPDDPSSWESWADNEAAKLERDDMAAVVALQAVIDFDIGDGEEEFDDGFGDMIDSMHNALAAMYRVQRSRVTDKHCGIANSFEAALELVRVASDVRKAIERGRELHGSEAAAD